MVIGFGIIFDPAVNLVPEYINKKVNSVQKTI